MHEGSQLAHFTIADQIGSGGMGAVYRARDTRLNRDVALKLLPPAFSEDPERLARFQREAQSLAALQHPNIASIYGIETAEGQTFLVMELCEGDDLSVLIERGPLPVAEARDIAGQIARGLEEAHEKGIIHRDLKPANVKVSAEGKVKILDFGLARTFSEDQSATDVSGETMTAAVTMTRPGVVLGTAAYMSPEQARGKAVDKRTDIWAFGVILYEMLTGKRLFAGETVSDILASVLRQEPDFEALPADLPLEMAWVVRRCLDRNRESRLRDIGEARCLVSSDASASSLSLLAQPTARAAEPRKKRNWQWPAVAAVAVIALVVQALSGGSGGGDDPEHGPRARRYTQLTTMGKFENTATMAPGGQFFVYAARDGDDPATADMDIFLQRANGLNPINLTADSPEADYQPAVSPDGQQIVFVSHREGRGIFVMGATGESARLLVASGALPAWSPDSRQIAYSTENFLTAESRQGTSRIWIIGADGQGARQLPIAIDAIQPAWSPDGSRLAFWSVRDESGQRDIWTVRADGTDLSELTNDAALDFCPVWSPDGRWVYFLSNRGGMNNLWRLRVDQASGLAQGEPELFTLPSPDVRHFSITADGGQLLFSARRETRHIYQVPIDTARRRLTGRPQPVLTGSMPLREIAVSPDGQSIAFTRSGELEDLFIVGADGRGLRQLTNDVDRDRGVAWYDGGKRLIFYSDRGGKYDFWSIRSDGADLHQLTDGPRSLWYPRAPEGAPFATAIDDEGTYRLEWSADRTQLGQSSLMEFAGLAAGERFYSRCWSGDGRYLLGWLAADINDLNPEIASWDRRDDILTRISTADRPWPDLNWSADGRFIILIGRNGVQTLDPADGSTSVLLANEDFPDVSQVVPSPRGDVVFLLTARSESDVWAVDLDK